jgi:hypothetical protein
MEIAVDGWRASAADWEAVKGLPEDQVPALSSEQREVARKVGIPEIDYARSGLAGKRSQEALLAKAERLGRLLAGMSEKAHISARIEKVTLRTFDEKFDISLRLGQETFPFRIAEQLVDDLLENGSGEAEQRVMRILETVVQTQLRTQ